MKITNNKFLTSTLMLILSGMSTKVLGLVIKVVFTRIVGASAIGLYTIVMPTYSLLLTICTLAMPTTIAKLIAQNSHPKIMGSALTIILAVNAIIILLMFGCGHFIADTLLKEPNAYYLLIAMSLTLPFASIACILKGYYYGKQKMLPHVVSNTVEQIIRLLIVITIMPKLIQISYVHAATGLILTSFFTELASIIVFLLFMNKKNVIYISKVNFNQSDAKSILDLSVPSVTSRIVGNICYFLEPIILTNILLYTGYTNDYILLEYGAYNAYAISTLTIPSFFISAISLALIPEIAKFIHDGKYQMVKKRLKQAFSFAFLIGIIFVFGIFVFRNQLLFFLYNTTMGANYIKYLAPFFILFYFEAIFSSFMQTIDKPQVTLRITFIGSIIKLFILALLSFLRIGVYSLLIAEIINILFVVIANYIYTKHFLKKLH